MSASLGGSDGHAEQLDRDVNGVVVQSHLHRVRHGFDAMRQHRLGGLNTRGD